MAASSFPRHQRRSKSQQQRSAIEAIGLAFAMRLKFEQQSAQPHSLEEIRRLAAFTRGMTYTIVGGNPTWAVDEAGRMARATIDAAAQSAIESLPTKQG